MMRCAWWKSRGVVAEGFVAKKISNANFCFVRRGEVMGVRFLDFYLKGKY
jgi:hypothetical protein